MMHSRSIVLLIGFLPIFLLLLAQPSFCQLDTFQFQTRVQPGNYYLLSGTIDNKYPISMKLTIDPAVRCGEAGKAVQWKNGGIQKQKPLTILAPDFEPDTTNTVHLQVNAKNEIRLEDQLIQKVDICQNLQPLLLKGKRVYLTSERQTNFKRYLDVYKAVRACIQELRAQKVRELFGKEIDELTELERKELDEMIPWKIIEDAPK